MSWQPDEKVLLHGLEVMEMFWGLALVLSLWLFRSVALMTALPPFPCFAMLMMALALPVPSSHRYISRLMWKGTLLSTRA